MTQSLLALVLVSCAAAWMAVRAFRVLGRKASPCAGCHGAAGRIRRP